MISEGLNLFHYSTTPTTDRYIKSNLTSGFLSAIQAFTLEARESEIEYFESKDEYFLFTTLTVKSSLLICVYDKDSNRSLADSILNQIRTIILNSHIVTENYTREIDDERNVDLSEKIDHTLQLVFENNYPTSIASNVFDNSSFSIVRVFNLENAEIYYENARPKPLLKEAQIVETKLLVAALDKICDRMDLPRFELIVVEYQGAMVTLMRNYNTVALIFDSGIINHENIKSKTLQLFDIADFSTYKTMYSSSIKKYSGKMDDKGNLYSSSGMLQVPMIDIFFSSFFNALGRFSSSFIRKPFTTAEIYVPSNNFAKIFVRKDKESYSLEIFNL